MIPLKIMAFPDGKWVAFTAYFDKYNNIHGGGRDLQRILFFFIHLVFT
jgi:hypothetical protein